MLNGIRLFIIFGNLEELDACKHFRCDIWIICVIHGHFDSNCRVLRIKAHLFSIRVKVVVGRGHCLAEIRLNEQVQYLLTSVEEDEQTGDNRDYTTHGCRELCFTLVGECEGHCIPVKASKAAQGFSFHNWIFVCFELLTLLLVVLIIIIINKLASSATA